MKLWTISVYVVVLTVLVGCTTPDVSTELKATNDAFVALKTATRPALKDKSKVEIKAAEEFLIQNKQLVVNTIGICQPVGALATVSIKTPPESCQLDSKVDVVSGAINASQVIALETAIEVYLASLLALADATSVAEAQTQTGNLVLAIESLAKKQSSRSLDRLAARATSEKDRLTGAVGFVVNQYRHQALAKAVRRGEAVIQQTSADLYRYYERQNPKLSVAAKALNTAEVTMTNARISGTVDEYRSAISAFRTKYTEFDALRKKDPSAWYANFARAHSALNKQLKSGGNIDDLIAAIDDLIALKP